ncbi:MAG: hypothetical protein LBB72_03050 [Spirochaetaceae bacterium]|jgi:hypothetical protein|nr:hypothetical protein [Spirochaetaceae bacterium]
MKKKPGVLLISLWVFLAGCPVLDPEEAVKTLCVMQSVPGKADREIWTLDLDPGEEARVIIMDPDTGGYPPASVHVSSASVSARQGNGDYLITGINPGGMGIIRFSAWGKTGELRVFVRNWAQDEVYRHSLYADMTNYPYDENVSYKEKYYNIYGEYAAPRPKPYTGSDLAVYRLITDSGFHYEAPDGLSRRITNQYPDMVHSDSPREVAGWREVHPVPHIVMAKDTDYFAEKNIFALNKEVFKFIIHFENDGDMVGGYADRQRLELKTMDETTPPNAANNNDRMYSNGGGDTFTHRWKFRLPADLRVSGEYTHIHQIKPEGGDSGNPTFTLTARKLRTGREVMQLIYRGPIRDNGDPSVNWYPCQVDLAPFKGEWIYAEETITYDNPGTYRIRLVRIRDLKVLLEYIYSPEHYEEVDPFVMFRKGNSYIRPKFGFYRRILHMTSFGLPNMDDPVTEFRAENNEVVVLYADIEMDKLKR